MTRTHFGSGSRHRPVPCPHVTGRSSACDSADPAVADRVSGAFDQPRGPAPGDARSAWQGGIFGSLCSSAGSRTNRVRFHKHHDLKQRERCHRKSEELTSQPPSLSGIAIAGRADNGRGGVSIDLAAKTSGPDVRAIGIPSYILVENVGGRTAHGAKVRRGVGAYGGRALEFWGLDEDVSEIEAFDLAPGAVRRVAMEPHGGTDRHFDLYLAWLESTEERRYRSASIASTDRLSQTQSIDPRFVACEDFISPRCGSGRRCPSRCRAQPQHRQPTCPLRDQP